MKLEIQQRAKFAAGGTVSGGPTSGGRVLNDGIGAYGIAQPASFLLDGVQFQSAVPISAKHAEMINETVDRLGDALPVHRERYDEIMDRYLKDGGSPCS